MANNFNTPKETCDLINESSVSKVNLSVIKRFLLSFMAGAFIALGGQGFLSVFHDHFLRSAVFPVGLMLIVLVGGELFTGNCLMTIGRLNNKIKTKDYITSILQVFLGNLIGSLFIVLLVYYSGMYKTGSSLFESVIAVGKAKSSLSFTEALFKGILCNILVTLGVWFATSAKDITGKIFGCWFPIMLFVLCGYEHCVANMFFMPLACILDSSISLLDVINNIIPVTLGNFIGGGLIIPIIYYCIYYKK